MTVYKYVIYGLGVRSQIPLWGEEVENCTSDIDVQWEVDQPPNSPTARAAVNRAGEISLSWPDVCDISIRDGTNVVVRTGADAEPTYLRHLVSGIGIGLALHQRGVFTLHAGAVEIAGKAVVIMGHKGAGKSTLAAALRARGHALLSDDVVALDIDGDGPPFVRVGAPNMNLWPDSALATGHDPSIFSPICARSPKLAGWLPDRRPEEPVQLGAIVVLSGESGGPRHQRLGPVESFTQLITHSHAFRWIPEAHDQAHHLAQCRQVLRHAPMMKLSRGDSLESLSTLAELVERVTTEHVGSPFSPATP